MAVPGMLHACTDGKFVDLKSGAIYEYVPQATSGTVASPTPKPLPKVTLSESAKRYIASAKEALSHEEVEHFVSLGIDAQGHICAEDQQTQNLYDRCHVEVRPILTKFTQ